MGFGDELCLYKSNSYQPSQSILGVYIYVAFAEIGAYHIHCVAVKISSR